MNTQYKYTSTTVIQEGTIDDVAMMDVDSSSNTTPVNAQLVQQRKEETYFKDIIIEHGLPKIQALSHGYGDLCDEEQQFVVRSFQLFSKCARVKVNRLLKLGGIHKRNYISCGCLETEVFQVIFEAMEGAKFFHSDRTINRHGIKYKVPCFGYRFQSILPMLDIFENWGRQVISSTTQMEDDTYIRTLYLLEVNSISFIMDTESNEITMHFSYDTKIKYEDEDEFTFF
ncbi:hypothetical protein NAEGRDRAFT_63160 [Naegleria gruberi]|uniref:Uncharacterized protein n=1 Tax=Naegleria gruberi TaxID=5762 RepID=D2V2Y5_NAEGR|nr:uncharacterized protein NAEGRDRAFT_63160 [Naegleria gruberi]EFC48689.1 hypothetical protein NAEGRDRAFT_63160 [Naegleria gruberi]|eukprot:XP_002681433.1 hypothetical protein NAEGRDRAFT_63160 [Naegleria gruberi strain NEG-M]